jgi:peptide chain release factor
MIRLLLTSGRGPAECRIALGHVMAEMAKDALTFGVDVDFAIGPLADKHGPASAIAVVGGVAADAFVRRWVGSIQWVAQSSVRPHHKRKNWFVGVMQLPVSAVAAGETIKLCDVQFETFRAGGPGGQHQNKTESAVRAVHRPSGLSAVARDGRSQHRNKAIALERLAGLFDLREQFAREGEKLLVQAGHDRLERGTPVRRFLGMGFKAG